MKWAQKSNIFDIILNVYLVGGTLLGTSSLYWNRFKFASAGPCAWTEAISTSALLEESISHARDYTSKM